MKFAWKTGFVASLALLATLVGHFAIHKHFERGARLVNLDETDFRSPNLPFTASELKQFNIPRFLADVSPEKRVLPAVDIQGDHQLGRVQRVGDPPTPVPAPNDAVPVEIPPSDETLALDIDTSAVRKVIEHELSHASREEREIWFDELKSLPAGVVRDLLQVRKQLHALPRLLGGMPEKLASADPGISGRTHEIAAEPASQKIRFNAPDYVSATAALEAAVSQMRHNLTNAATPGFKRLRVTLVDAYSCNWPGSNSTDEPRAEPSHGIAVQGEGCRIGSLLLDLKQGGLKKTVRQFDMAIDGEGFFVVRRGEKEFLTRCGAFTLDSDRRLCLAMTNDDAILQPVIKIPLDIREIQVSADGVVTALKSGETTLATIGNLQLAQVPSPARLQPAGNSLLIANAESGAVVLGSPMSNGLGEIQQGFLEQSNVDFEKEREEIEELTTILKSLPLPNFRPATANSLQQTPTH